MLIIEQRLALLHTKIVYGCDSYHGEHQRDFDEYADTLKKGNSWLSRRFGC